MKLPIDLRSDRIGLHRVGSEVMSDRNGSNPAKISKLPIDLTSDRIGLHRIGCYIGSEVSSMVRIAHPVYGCLELRKEMTGYQCSDGLDLGRWSDICKLAFSGACLPWLANLQSNGIPQPKTYPVHPPTGSRQSRGQPALRVKGRPREVC